MANFDRRVKHTLADPETGLHNRVSLRLELERMSARAQRYGFPLGLITISFPDQAEPAMGELGRFLAHGVRTSDCLARTDRCELRLLLSHEDVEHAPRVMDRLHALIDEFNARNGTAAHPDFSLDTELDVEAFAGALAGA